VVCEVRLGDFHAWCGVCRPNPPTECRPKHVMSWCGVCRVSLGCAGSGEVGWGVCVRVVWRSWVNCGALGLDGLGCAGAGTVCREWGVVGGWGEWVVVGPGDG
jgi:hypothetical protein